jgi:hypothetical protein
MKKNVSAKYVMSAFIDMMDLANSASSLANSGHLDIEAMRNGAPISRQYVVY